MQRTLILAAFLRGRSGQANEASVDRAQPPLASKSRAWLLQERERIEAELPWGQWVVGGALLIPVGALGVAGGYLGQEGRAFGPNESGPGPAGPRTETTVGIWVSGGAFSLGGIVLCTVVTILRRLGAARLEALDMALEWQIRQPQLELR